jgi:hypothetical protein
MASDRDNVPSEPVETWEVLAEVAGERARQDQIWGVQDLPNGTGPSNSMFGVRLDKFATTVRRACEQAAETDTTTWLLIAAEEAFEAFSTLDPRLLREEVIQLAAVCVAWVECIDRGAVTGGAPAAVAIEASAVPA